MSREEVKCCGPITVFLLLPVETQIKLNVPLFQLTESCDLVVIAITACCVINQSIFKDFKK